MNRLINTTKIFLSVYYAHMLEYRAELFFWILSNSLPLILMGVWIQASQGGKFGLTPEEFMRYFLSVFIVRQFTVVWMIFDFEKEVVEGQLSPKLLQPIDPVWHHVAGHLSERFVRLPLSVILLGLFFLFYPPAFWLPSLTNLLLFLFVTAMAFALRFLIQYTLALLAFWTERASSLEEFWHLFFLFLSGMMAPLEVFPPAVRAVAEWTPFPYLVHFPAVLLVGLPTNILQGILVMVGWGLLFFGLNRWLWRKGLKQYSGMGA